MNNISLEVPATKIESDPHVAFFTIKCGEIYRTPDKQFFLLNCGKCDKGYCSLSEFIDHVNQRSCEVPAGPASDAPAGGCGIMCEDSNLNQRNLSDEDTADIFKELIEYTGQDDEGHRSNAKEAVDENYLLPETDYFLFEEMDSEKGKQPITGETSYEMDQSGVDQNIMSKPVAVKGVQPMDSDAVTVRMIELYKFHDCLWDKGHPDYHNRKHRTEMFHIIVNTINDELHTSLNVQDLSNKLNKLRCAFYKELRKLRAFESSNNDPNAKFISNYWFFNLLKFLKGNASAFLEVPKSNMLLDVVDAYRRSECLWNKSHHEFRNRRVRYAAYDAIASSIEMKYSIRTTRGTIISQIKRLRAIYAQTLRSEVENKEQTSTEEPSNLSGLILSKMDFLKGKIRGSRKLKCDHCEKVFFSNSKYKLHQKQHTGDLPFSCNLCQKQFLHKASLQAHKDTHLDVSERRFTCEFCGLKIANPTNYRVHIQRHKGELRHECERCKKRFGTTTELKNHILDHTGEKPNICDKCGNQYKSKSELTRHLRLHDDRKGFKCEYCPKAFHFEAQLNQHLLVHVPKPCDVCGEEINGRRAFIRHKKLHHTLRDVLSVPKNPV